MTLNLALILSLLVVGGGLLAVAITKIRKSGEVHQQNIDLKSLADIQAAQARANANAPKTKTELLDRIKNGGI